MHYNSKYNSICSTYYLPLGILLVICVDLILLAIPTEPNRNRIATDGPGPYAVCRQDKFVDQFDPEILNNTVEFNERGGEALLYSQVECSMYTLSIRYSPLYSVLSF